MSVIPPDDAPAADPTEVAPTGQARPASAPWPPEPGGMVAGRYQVDAVIGRGGSGVVLRGHDLETGALVAIKVVPERAHALEAAVEREAQVLTRLDHPGIVRHFGHGRVAGAGAFLVLELLVGETLRERLQAAPLAPREACALVARLLRALAHAHARGVVHRDVKPANVFLVGRSLERPKLIDFGVALAADERSLDATRVAGTPVYMAPEQAAGEPDLDGRVDVFAAGCVLVECASGRPLFEGAGLAPFAKLALSDRLVAERGMDDLPPELFAIVARMLASDRARRPSDADALAAELEALAAALPATTRTVGDTAGARLGTQEARPLVVLLLGPGARGGEAQRAAERSVVEIAQRAGGEVQRLPSSASLVTFGVGAGARDQAIRAARAALELRSRLPGRAMAITLSRATMDRRALVGPALDEGSRILAGGATAAAIGVDAETASLLAGRFAIAADGSRGELRLEGELAGGGTPRTLLGRPVPFAGRERELETLLERSRASLDGSGAFVGVVVAPPGAGKTRLRQEVLDRLGRDGTSPLVLAGSGDALAAGAPYALLGSALRAVAGIEVRSLQREAEADAADARRIAALVDEFAPASTTRSDGLRLGTFLGELAGVRSGDRVDQALRAARRDGRLMADQVRLAFVDWLGCALARGPVVLALDDLHWGDAPSFALVAAALRAHARRPLTVLGFARGEIDERYPGLWAELAPLRIALEPLDHDAADAMARAIVPELDAAKRAALVARAAGNPFFLEELLRHAVERRDRREDEADVEAPATVLAAVQARLDRVAEGGRRVLRAASVYGETFATDGVEALLDRAARRDASAWLGDLARRDLVVRDPAPEGVASRGARWRFRHALVRDAAYDTLTDGDRRVGHRLAAGFLARQGERGLGLALHLERAGDGAGARRELLVAADDAVRANDFDGALDRCRRAERLGAAGVELGLVRLAEARAHVWRSAWTDVLRCAREAEPWLEGDDAFVATEHALIALALLGRMDEYRDGHRALVARRPASASVAWSTAVLRSAGDLVDLGELDDVERLLASIEDVPDEPELDAFRDRLVAGLLAARGDLARAAAVLLDAHAGFERAGDVREGCSNLNTLVAVLLELGRTREAIDRAGQLVELCRRIDHRFILKFALVNLGLAQLMRGDGPAAQRSIEEARAMAREANEPRVEGFALLLLAQAALADGRGTEALGHAEASLAKLGDDRGLAFVAESALARALVRLDRASEAGPRARDAVAALRAAGGTMHGELTVWLAGIEAARAAGANDDAIALAREAIGSLERRLGALAPSDRSALLGSPLEVAALRGHALALGIDFPS